MIVLLSRCDCYQFVLGVIKGHDGANIVISSLATDHNEFNPVACT
jgi:hypothetical protein